GHPASFSDAAIQSCLTLKGLFGLGLRQTTGLVASLLRLCGLDWAVPDFSTLSRRGKTLAVAVPYRPSSGALHLLVDSTGIKLRGDGEWHRRKHGRDRPRRWLKLHLAVDAESLQVRAIEVTDGDVGDSSMLPHLLDQISPQETLSQVTADGAYDTRPCRAAIAARGAAALIPPRRNGQPWSDDAPGAVTRNEALRACRRLGWRVWRTWSSYHVRSRVEATMACLKRLGERIMARQFDRQVAELQVRAAILNRFTTLGTPVTQLVHV
ncbi:MAG: IS5 family transposase, partial [Rhodospirillales bacterium]|nr:IS5 family transposase [Acetobacter sp.]